MRGTVPARACSWDNDVNPQFNFYVRGNAEEVLPGVVTPFAATYFSEMDYRMSMEFAERIDVSDLFPSFPPPVSNFISFMGGRCVLNLAWANALIATWTTSEGSGLMGQFLTTKQADVSSGALQDRERAAQVQRTVYTRFWPQCAASIPALNRRVGRLREEQAAMDLGSMSDRALWRYAMRLLRFQAHVLTNHIGDSGPAGEFASILGKLLAAELGDRFEEGMVAGLTTGLGEIESSLPGFEIWRLGRFVARRPALARDVARMGAHEMAAALAAPPSVDWKAFKGEIDAFIAAYGFRGQSEMDPAVPSWADDPTFVLSVIKADAAAADDRDPRPHSEAGLRARAELEAEILAMLRPGARALFRKYRDWLQKYARARERSKACWARSVRLSRPVLLELADRARERGLTATTDDFWYLTMAEAATAFAGRPEASYAERIASRRAEQGRLQAMNLPEVFEAPPELVPEAPPPAPGAELTGLGVSAGQASGRARVITSAAAAEEADLEPGEVLIAPYTDAAWTPLFVPAAAVVVETGGMLSHAATVAREYGIPAVVAVRGATNLIRTGDMVFVDGAAGLVRIG